jgi:hypothetical protein
MAKYWITKYALSQGIIEIDDDETKERYVEITESGGLWVRDKRSGYHDTGYYGNDWHKTHEAALKRAEEMRLAKIKSLQKQMDKLQKLTFQDGK